MSTVDLRVWLSLAYVFGTLIHLLMRSDLAVKSKVNVFPTHWSWFAHFWVSIVVRGAFWGYGLFWLWLLHPDWPSKVASALFVPDGIANWLTVAPSLGAAIAFGFFCDVFLDYIQVVIGPLVQKYPYLTTFAKLIQSQIPQYDPSVVDVSKTDGGTPDAKQEPDAPKE